MSIMCVHDEKSKMEGARAAKEEVISRKKKIKKNQVGKETQKETAKREGD